MLLWTDDPVLGALGQHLKRHYVKPGCKLEEAPGRVWVQAPAQRLALAAFANLRYRLPRQPLKARRWPFADLHTLVAQHGFRYLGEHRGLGGMPYAIIWLHPVRGVGLQCTVEEHEAPGLLAPGWVARPFWPPAPT